MEILEGRFEEGDHIVAEVRDGGLIFTAGKAASTTAE